MKIRNRRFWKRVLAMLLAACMVMTTLVGNAFAFSLSDIPALIAGEEQAEDRAELKDYFFFSDKVSIYLASTTLREAALSAIRDGETADPEEIRRAVSSDAGVAKEYNEYFFSGREVYELTLPEEVKETLKDSGLDFRAYVRSGNVADDYQEKGAVQETAGNRKNLVLYQSGTSLDFLMSEADLNPTIREERNDDYTLTGSEEIAFVFFNNKDEKENFVLNIDGKKYCSIKVGSRETALRGLLKEVQKILKKQAKAQAEEDGEDEENTAKASGSSAVKASGSSAVKASGSDAAKASGSNADTASSSNADTNPADCLDQEEVDFIESNFDSCAADSSAGKFVIYSLAELAMDHYQNTDVEGYDIEVFVNKDAFEEPVELKVTKLVKPEEEAAADEAAVILSAEQIELLQKKGAYENSQSFDVRFENAAGAEIEPKGTAKVRITADKAALPEGSDLTSMQIFHMKENASGKIEKIENLTGEEALTASLKLLDDQDQEVLSLSAASAEDDAAFDATGAIVNDTASSKGIAAPEMTEEELGEINARTAKVVADVVVDSFSTLTLAPILKANGDGGNESRVMTVMLGEETEIKDGTITTWGADVNVKKYLKYRLQFVGGGTGKKLLIKIPTGWMIRGMSAPTGMELPVENLGLDEGYRNTIRDVTLSGVEPVEGTEWNNQKITDYKWGQSTDANVKTYGGIIEYTIDDATQLVELYVNISVRPELLPHDSVTEDMPVIDSVLSYTKNGEEKTEQVRMESKVINVPLVSFGTSDSGLEAKTFAYVAADGEAKGFSEQFSVGTNIINWNKNNTEDANESTHIKSLVDKVEYKVTYPEGIYFQDRILFTPLGLGKEGGTGYSVSGWEKNTEGTTTEYRSSNTKLQNLTIIKAENAQGGGTVTFRYEKGGLKHSSSWPAIAAYFKARTAEDSANPGYPFIGFEEGTYETTIKGIKVESEIDTRGGDVIKNSHSYTRTFYTGEAEKRIELRPQTVSRANLWDGVFPGTEEKVQLKEGKPDAFAENPLSTALGFCEINSQANYKNTTFYFEAPDINEEDIARRVKVTGLQVPGTNIRDVILKTSKGRVFKAALNNVKEATSQYGGTVLTQENLGLDPDEYILAARFTTDLKAVQYSTLYLSGTFIYLGYYNTTSSANVEAKLKVLKGLDEEDGDEFADEEGNIKGKDNYLSEVTLITKPEWKWTGAGNVVTYAGKAPNPTKTEKTFKAGDDIYFASSLFGGVQRNTKSIYGCTTMINPTVIITLPEEVQLNTNDIAVTYEDKEPETGILILEETKKGIKDSNNNNCIAYIFKVKEGERVFARDSSANKRSSITVYANAHVSAALSSAKTISLKDAIRFDVNGDNIWDSTGESGHFVVDTNNVMGKGTTHNLVAGGDSFGILTNKGMNMDLAFKAIFDSDYHTYNGQKSSISLVQASKNAEMVLKYFSTDETQYLPGTSIYVPITKADIHYDKYFENIDVGSNPGVSEGTDQGYDKEKKFSLNLAAYPKMKMKNADGEFTGESSWTTYYAVGKVKSNAKSPSELQNQNLWVPVTASDDSDVIWYTEAQIDAEIQNGRLSLADVVMLKFKLDSESAINVGEGGEAIIPVVVEGNDEAKNGDNCIYWRAYGKAVYDEGEQAGNWTYSSVVAAMPACEQVFGQIFLDMNNNGIYEEPVLDDNGKQISGDIPYTGDDVTVKLNRYKFDYTTSDGFETVDNEGGSLRVTDAGKDKYLSSGVYKVDVTFKPNDNFELSKVKPVSAMSNGYNESKVWANDYTLDDIKVGEVEKNGDKIYINAGGVFKVNNNAAVMHYFGIALRPVIRKNFVIQKDLKREWKDSDNFAFYVKKENEDTQVRYEISNDDDHKVSTEPITYYSPGEYSYTVEEYKHGTVEKGLTYDPDKKTVKVVVSEMEGGVPGQLTAQVVYPDPEVDAVVFRNTYEATGKTEIKGNKTLKFTDGRDIDLENEKKFKFELTPVSGKGPKGETITAEQVPMPASVIVENDADGNFTFGEIEFKQEGTWTYTYKVTEIVPPEEERDTTVAYDNATYIVEVTATDDLNGNLTCTQAFKKDNKTANSIAFANVRSYEPVSVVVEAGKKLHGRNLIDGEFTFRLEAKTNNAPVPADAKNVGENVTFGEISYTDPGTYEYVLKELKPAQADTHLDYSKDEVKVKVQVNYVEGTKNQLTASVLYDDKTEKHTFVNTFNAEPIAVNFGVRKTLNGREWIDSDSYRFILSPGSNDAKLPDGSSAGILTPMPGENFTELKKASAAVDGDQYSRKGQFGNIEFRRAGTYYYTIAEAKGSIGGVTYDTNTINVTVTVTAEDSDGSLNATVSYGGTENAGFAAFTNLYTVAPASLVLGGTKTLTTKEGTPQTVKDGTFRFRITPENGAPEAASADVFNDEDARFTFGAINFTVPGEYTYKVSEIEGTDTTIEYDKKVYTYFVKVIDKKDGNLGIEVRENDANGAVIDEEAYKTHAAFTNKYILDVANVDLDVTKVLAGRKLQAGEFSFKLTGTAGYPMPEGAAVPAGGTLQEKTAANDADGKVNFGSISYAMPGTYVYHITEQIPADADKLKNVAYDGTDFEVIVNVSQVAGSTKLVTQVTYNGGNKAEFRNVYTPDPVKASIKVSKKLEGRKWKNGEAFEFKIEGKEKRDVKDSEGNAVDIPMPMPESQALTITKGTEESAAYEGVFGAISYAYAGVYRYAVTETKGQAAGVTYDETTAEIEVRVTANEDTGKLSAEVVYPEGAEAAKFTNTYAASGKAEISGTKSFKFTDGTAIGLTAGQFAFNLAAVSGIGEDQAQVTVPMPAAETVRNDANGNFTFGDIRFTQAGTYTYQVTESAGSDATIAYDDTVYTVVVTVTDDLESNLTCTPVIKKDETIADSIAFVNVRKYEPATAMIQAEKRLDGKNLTDGAFTFQLEAKTENAPMPNADTTENVGKDVAFGEITFPVPGTYEYSLREVKPAQADSHMDYSKDEVTVKVKVELDQTTTNQLKASVLYDGKAEKHTFVNTFKAAAKTAQIGVKKTLDGRGWIGTDSYSFSLAAGTNTAKLPDGSEAGITTPMPAGSANELTITKDSTTVEGDQYSRTGLFGDITFEHAGVYNYTITETKGQIGGITYDERTINVKVTVTADDTTGALEITVSYGDTENAGFAAFTNLYTVAPAELVLGGSKTLTTKDRTAKTVGNGQFRFKIEPQGEAPAATSAEVFNDANARFAFGAINFTKAGEYTYKVSEIEGSDTTITYDKKEYTYVVTVTDELDGTLSIKVKDENGAEIGKDAYLTHAAFANTYNYEPVDVSLDVSKVLAGRALKAEEFSFRLTGKEGTPMPAGSTDQVKTVKNAADGKVDFGAIHYEMPGAYRYHIAEEIPDDAGRLENVTYDGTDYEVLVNVSQMAGSAELVSQITYTNTTTKEAFTKAVFRNVYKPDPVTAGIKVSKKLEGRKWNSDDSFEFKIKGKAMRDVKDSEGKAVEIDMPMPESTTLTIKKGTEESAAYEGAFGNISFAHEGVYTYTVTETKGQIHGVTYAGADAEVEVVVRVTADKATGELSAAVSYGNGAEAAEFLNTYTPDPVRQELKVKKTLTGRPWQNWDEFTFRITAKDGAPATAKSEVKVSGEEPVSFGEAEFTKAGSYQYEIQEITAPKSRAKGVTYDQHHETVTVEVSYDDTAGKLSIASVKYSSDAAASAAPFENVYKADPVVLTLKGRKSVEDTTNDGSVRGNAPKKISDYDGAFSFTLASGEAPLPEKVKVTNNSQGKFAFGPITYEKAGDYTYTITEDNVDTARMPGITKDITEYGVTVKVTDNYETGKLEISSITWDPEKESGEAEFLNLYAADPATAEIKGSKELKDRSRAGRLLEEGAYKFHVAALSADAPLPEKVDVTNDADGNFVFTFADDAFRHVGNYQYNVIELQPEAGTKPDGYSYDPSVYLVNIKVTDNGNAALKAEVSYQKTTGTDAGSVPQKADFSNTYQARKTTAVLRGEKILEDLTSNEAWGRREIGDGEFRFTLTPDSGYENGEQDASHSTIAVNQIPMPVEDTVVVNDADGKFAFGTIEYKHAGDYFYQITETEGSVSGMTYDAAPKYVKVHVEDPVEPEGRDQEAQLYATISYLGDTKPDQSAGVEASGDSAKVKNVYAAAPVDVVIDGTKVFDDLTNRTRTAKTLAAEEFRFTLTAEDGAPMPEGAADGTAIVSNTQPDQKNNAAYAFGTITYEKEGIYTYTLKEVNDSEKGVAYDETEYKVTVTVVDGRKEAGGGRHVGELSAAVAIETDGETAEKAAFSNTYSAKPTTAELKGFKQFIDMTNLTEDRKQLAAGDFSFELKADGNTAGIKADGEAVTNPMPEGTENGVATVTNDENGSFTFGKMTFEHVGEYKYTMTEVNDGKDGMIYDPTVYHFTVTVTDDNAELKAVVTMTAGSEERSAFLSGLAESLTRLIKDLADRIVDFFKGILGIETEAEQGAEADEAPVPVATFTNAYAAEKATASVAVKKSLKDLSSTYKELEEGQFTFSLKASGNNAMAEVPNPMPAGSIDGIATASNAADGSVNFGDMVFQFVGDYTYTVTEVNDGKAGYSYDDTEYTVTVSVTDNADGTLSAEVSYSPEEAEFRNTYKSAKTTLDKLEGVKELTGKPLDQGEYKFVISAESAQMLKGGDITDEDGRVLTAPLPKETVASNSNAEHMDEEYTGTYEAPFAFGEIEYEHAGIYTYTVKEQAGTDKRVAYDDTAYTVTVKVEDTEEAKLAVTEITYAAGGEKKEGIRFANTFTFEPVEVTLKATENLYGRTQHTGEFNVLLEKEDEAAITEEAAKGEATIIGAVDRMFNVLTAYAAEILDKVNEGEGNRKANVTFRSLKFTREDIGKQYIYNMHQEIGTLGGVTYDETNYRIRVTVGVDKNDTTAMAALLEYEGEDGSWTEVTDAAETFVFDNYYRTEGEAELKMKKVLNGRKLAADEFEFELYETTGGTRTKLASAKNDADGNVTFPVQKYSKGYVVAEDGMATELADTSGKHTYEITEVQGTLDRVTYDTRVITVTVDARDNEDGTMKVTTSSDSGDTFTNFYRTSGGGGGSSSGGGSSTGRHAAQAASVPAAPETPEAPAVPFDAPLLGALPKTGAALGSVMFLALFGILGLFGFVRRKKDEDEEE